MRDLLRKVERMEEQLSPHERFCAAVSAMSRGDVAQLDRLNDQTPYRPIREQEPAYFRRLQCIASFAFEHGMRVQRQKLIAMTAIAALAVLDESRSENVGTSEKLGEVLDLVIPRIRALEKAWDEFCSELRLVPAEVRSAFHLSGDFADELIGELSDLEFEPDEATYAPHLDYLQSRWKHAVTDHCRNIESFGDKPRRRN